MNEFTGERVIPGQVEDDLWAEHIARYAFASRFVTGKRVLDIGCGTGYGTAELARRATEAVGVDVSRDAIDYATEHYRAARFMVVPASDLPFPDACFDVITSFELIEHLSDWRALLMQARRVLHPAGLFIVSTPNKLYYAEARGLAGPNPFHEHEFEYAEFDAGLREFFPHVKILLQDRLEAFGFYQASRTGAAEGHIAESTEDPSTSNFFVAVCSTEELPPIESFLYVTSASNLLREREAHIHKLELELDSVRRWLNETTESRNALLEQQRRLEHDARDKAQWASELLTSLQAAEKRIVELQDAFSAAQADASRVVEQLNADLSKANEWGLTTSAELKQTAALLDQAEATVVERTKWAQRASTEADSLRIQLAQAAESRWVRIGRGLGVGPKIEP